MDKLPNLIKWCAEFGEKHNIKLHANTAPLDSVIDSLLERVESLENSVKELTEKRGKKIMSQELTDVKDNSFLSKDNFEHSFRIAKMMAASQMVPKGYQDKPQDVLIAMEMGRTWNLGPLQAVQNIAVINGKPCAYGDLVLAICSSHPDFENIEEEPILDKSDNICGYLCSIKRKGRSLVVQSYTIEDAKTAKLWAKPGPWSQYPTRMLQMRARAFALRDSFADALCGVNIAEEVQDYASVDLSATTQRPKPSSLKADMLQAIKKNQESVSEHIVNYSDIDPETGEVIQ